MTSSDRLVPTADAAKAIGVDRRTLSRWVVDGVVEPDLVTPGGHYRWNIERLKRALERPRR
ncbi:MerR family transcriptional regulator [Prauserella oleivorans]|uniref:MerR family transcriptional regulator n=1 Tax=Prauserella oleivorans TaxID=1478153 RepID=A0ABW5W6D7_9PSEU